MHQNFSMNFYKRTLLLAANEFRITPKVTVLQKLRTSDIECFETRAPGGARLADGRVRPAKRGRD